MYFTIFLPTKEDLDGLSLIDSRYRSREWSCVRSERSDVRFSLFVLPRELMEELWQTPGSFPFEYTPDAIDELFGEPVAHCVAVRINRGDYDRDKIAKGRIKEWAMQLAESFDRNLYELLPPYVDELDSVSYRPVM